MRLEKKITVHISLLMLVAMIILQFIFFKNIYILINTNNKEVLNIYSKALAVDQIIAGNLFFKNKINLNKHMLTIWPKLIDLNSVVITDLNGEVYFYKNKKNVLKSNINYKKILQKIIGNKYKIPKNNNLNNSFQEFTSITYKKQLVGMVGVKKYHRKNKEFRNLFIEEIIVGIILVFAIAILLGIYLAKAIKAEIFGYEPFELANIHNERQLIFNNLNSQILTLDNYGKLNQISEKAITKFDEQDLNTLKKLYNEVLMKKKNNILNRQIILSSERVIVNCMKIAQDRDKIEVLFILKKEKRIKKIAEEITGVTQIIESMRANVHEFKNKIHVISGLLKLEEYDEVQKYVSTLRIKLDEEYDEVQNIEDSVIKALLLTKISLAKEKQIFLDLQKGSNLMETHNKIYSDDLIVIIGNLIENSVESFHLVKTGKKEINIKISETENNIFISITDNGEKIVDSEKIFEMGYSSKGKNRGSGLALIKNLVLLYHGKINLIEDSRHKTFHIELTKEV